MDSSPSKESPLPTLPSAAGVKRPAALLPAFEPLSSSPGFPRPSKRRASTSARADHGSIYQKYPTPIPSSTTGILSSSPPRLLGQSHPQRIHSSTSERTPLSAVPSVVLAANGDELLMGRSSNSSHYQLSANRLISRVHVKARYVAAAPVTLESELPKPNKIEIVCTGWNGLKLHCQGRTWELAKGDSFASETEGAEIMVDVQDARVLLQWPGREKSIDGNLSDSSWDSDGSPSRRAAAIGLGISSSPLRREPVLRSPVSPSPAGPNASMSTLFAESIIHPAIKVYEDEPVDEAKIDEERLKVETKAESLDGSQSSDLSDLDDEDPDEENDPIVHSFGPFGANLSSHMASFTAGSPEQPRRRVNQLQESPLQRSPAKQSNSGSESTLDAEPHPVINHVINQLAFSRLSSTPLTAIMNNLPAAMKDRSPSNAENRGLTKDELRVLLEATQCIGIIQRQGKDAAGKQLESEYYYIPDEDRDEQRRAAVVDGLRKPSLRACRKQHKQYYWKRPKTP